MRLLRTQQHWQHQLVQRAEDFLRTAARLERFAGGAFDFISVCPPYELVDYNELYDLLEASPLVRCCGLVVMHLGSAASFGWRTSKNVLG